MIHDSVGTVGNGISRRSVVAGGLTLAAFGAVEASAFATPAWAVATWPVALPKDSLAVVIANARLQTGKSTLECPATEGWSSRSTTAGWCDRFVSWFLRGNGAPQAAGCTALYAAYATLGRTGSVAQPGALMFMDWMGTGSKHHVGLVTDLTGEHIRTIEGNTTPSVLPLGAYGNGTVQNKNRTLNGPRQKWFAYPVYQGYDSMTGVAAPGQSIQSTIARRNNGMSTLYTTKDAAGVTFYALAGDGRGRAAWIETKDVALYTAWAGQHGNAAYLNPATFASWKASYLSAEPTLPAA
ncbi:MAG: CHAP domain-containing protein [Cryobacterium sp.]